MSFVYDEESDGEKSIQKVQQVPSTPSPPPPPPPPLSLKLQEQQLNKKVENDEHNRTSKRKEKKKKKKRTIDEIQKDSEIVDLEEKRNIVSPELEEEEEAAAAATTTAEEELEEEEASAPPPTKKKKMSTTKRILKDTDDANDDRSAESKNVQRETTAVSVSKKKKDKKKGASQTTKKAKSIPPYEFKESQKNTKMVAQQLLGSRNRIKPVHCFTDGSLISLKLPGRDVRYIAGIGGFFPYEYNHFSEVLDEDLHATTSNMTEMYAIREVFKIVDNARPLFIYTDSLVCLNILSSSSSTGLDGINKETYDLISNRVAPVYIKHVKAHIGIENGNYYADCLATYGTLKKKDEILNTLDEIIDENSQDLIKYYNESDEDEMLVSNETKSPIANIEDVIDNLQEQPMSEE